MQEKQMNIQKVQRHVLIFDPGDEVMAGLLDFARRYQVKAAHITGLGVFSQVLFGYYQRETGDYKQIPIEEEVEVLSLVGTISLNNGDPLVHVHATVSTADGIAHGGHLLSAHVWPTLEVIVEVASDELQRAHSQETNLSLIHL